MKAVSVCLLVLVLIVKGDAFDSNITYIDAAGRQLQDFKDRNAIPSGYITSSAGEPTDIRDLTNINSDFLNRNFYFDTITHFDKERSPERVVHAKGVAAFGYFEVTNDVSKYTKAEVFNGVGKKTPIVLRFSPSTPRLGGSELKRDFKGLGVKFYSKEGNLDLTCLQTPIFHLKDAIDFASGSHSLRWNPRSNLIDSTMEWDFTIMRPVRLAAIMWVLSDYGLPRNYRTMDAFPIHTYEINNKHGQTHYVKFNFRTEQGFDFLTSAEALAIETEDPDYYTRDLYNAIKDKKFPSWRLEMDVMTKEEVKRVDYDPFDISLLWKNGTYRTITIGRLVVNAPVTNNFRDSELAAYNPGNLVPGITGPVDFLFKARRMAYRDTHDYRLGVNHDEIRVNNAHYKRRYVRDGIPPVRDNMWDNPNYYPNTFHGSVPIVDEGRPEKKLLVLSNNAVDFSTIYILYENLLRGDAPKQRLIDNIVTLLEPVLPSTANKVIKYLRLGHPDLGRRVARTLKAVKASKKPAKEQYDEIVQCLQNNV